MNALLQDKLFGGVGGETECAQVGLAGFIDRANLRAGVQRASRRY
jgi:hypothetical protein